MKKVGLEWEFGVQPGKTARAQPSPHPTCCFKRQGASVHTITSSDPEQTSFLSDEVFLLFIDEPSCLKDRMCAHVCAHTNIPVSATAGLALISQWDQCAIL